MLSPEAALAYGILAAMEGLLVLLPRTGAAAWQRLSPSPHWSLALPGALLIGTFGVLAVPASATGLAVLAGVATPILAIVAVLIVARGRRAAWLVVLPCLAVGALTLGGWPGGLATSALTGIGTLALGAALVHMTPPRWLGAGIASAAVVDVTLLATGVGQPAADLLETALSSSPLPTFHRAELGPITKDYPDLVIAAVLGSALAGHPLQRPAAALVTVLAAAYGLLFVVADMLPATVPVAVAAAVIALLHRSGFGVSRPFPRLSLARLRTRHPGPRCPPLTRRPPTPSLSAVGRRAGCVSTEPG